MDINTNITPDIYNLQPGDVFASETHSIIVVTPPHASSSCPDIVQVFAKENGKNLYVDPQQFVAHVASIPGMKPVGRLRLV